jgi:hypothetical protein
MKPAYDPYTLHDKMPEACGYGVRFLRLALKPAMALEITNLSRTTAEKTINLGNVLKLSLVKYEKLKKQSRFGESLGGGESTMEFENIPFELVTKNDGVVDLVSLSYEDFRIWTTGFQFLLGNANKVSTLSNKVKCLCI